MTTNITGDVTGASFPANVVAPSDGNQRDAASVQVPLEDLADRTHWNRRNPSMAVQNWTHQGVAVSGPGAFTPAGAAYGRFSPANDYDTWMVVGDYSAGTGAAYSTSGANSTWYVTGLTETEDLTGAVYDTVNGSWILFGHGGAIWQATSANGSWTDKTSGAVPFLGGASNGAGRVVLAGAVTGGAVASLLSDDGGVNWSAVTSFPVVNGIYDIARSMAYGSAGWVAGGQSHLTARAALWSSADGDTWTVDTVPGSVTGLVTSVCASGAYFVAVTDDGEILRKSGATWTKLTHGLPGTLDFSPGVASDPIGSGAIVAVSSSGSAPVNASLDYGATWEQVPAHIDSTVAPTAVMCTTRQWVIAGTGGTDFAVSTSLAMGG